jgi:D-3-phosphoglycerate dehydrogenase
MAPLLTFFPLHFQSTGSSAACPRVAPLRAAADVDEIALLEKTLSLAKTRKAKESEATAPAAAAAGEYTGMAFTVKTFNAISPVGLTRFPKGQYAVSGEESKLPQSPMAIMLRSHQLKEEEVPSTVRCTVRCGAGVNNIPVPRMTELGIPVFNTPGANANAVKDLV